MDGNYNGKVFYGKLMQIQTFLIMLKRLLLVQTLIKHSLTFSMQRQNIFEDQLTATLSLKRSFFNQSIVTLMKMLKQSKINITS